MGRDALLFTKTSPEEYPSSTSRANVQIEICGLLAYSSVRIMYTNRWGY
jgi:hypothetical protein